KSLTAWLLIGSALVAVMGALLVVHRRRHRRVGSDLWGWALVAGMLLVLTVTYLTSPHPLAYHLASSVDRATLAPRLLLASMTAVWLLLTIARGAREPALPPVVEVRGSG
ncbi:MAG TPA: hypothetical protein VIJ47_09975, partial [Acidimicrobiales bacterium]